MASVVSGSDPTAPRARLACIDPNLAPSADPKSFSRSSGRAETLRIGLGRLESESESRPHCASAMASAVWYARLRLDAKTWTIGPITLDRLARWAPNRFACRTPWFVRDESREPALPRRLATASAGVGQERELGGRGILTRGLLHYPQTRRDGREEGACWLVMVSRA
jgi:hypothetical protein